MPTIPIFFSFDNNYVPQAAVTFASLLSNAREDIFYELFVVHASISPQHREALTRFVATYTNATLSFIDISSRFNISFSDEFFSTKHFTIDTLYRCLPMLIQEFDKYEKIIYSDVDIVVVDDISELYEHDVTDVYLAGVK